MDSATNPLGWSLLRTVNKAKDSLGKKPASKSKRWDTASNLLYALEQFADRLEIFFETGFTGQAVYKLAESEYLPPEYVYNLLAEQISFDMDGILRANSQRKLYDDSRNNLAFADRLGYEILSSAIVANVMSPATVYSYFQKSLFIRLIPYARVAFVAIPYTAIGYNEDFLALPHELGHYVFRFGDFEEEGSAGEDEGSSRNSVKLYREMLAEAENWFDPWVEEIFADVFGCIFAGPRIANSFINLSRKAHGKWFNADDGHHPPPLLRPYIYIIALEKLASRWGIEFDKVISRLEEKWNAELRNETKVLLPGHQYPVLREQAVAKLREEVIGPMLKEGGPLYNLVEELKPASVGSSGKYDESLFRRWWGDVKTWNELIQPDGSIETLAEWNTIVLPDKILPVPDLVRVAGDEGLDTVTPKLTLDISNTSPELISRYGKTIKPKEIEFGKTGTPFDKLITELEKPGLVPAEKWFEVLTFGSWIDKGAGGPNAHT
jgi:hypothetical protein